MSIATEVTYVDGVTAVSAAWLNLIQEHLAGFLNLQVTAAAKTVTISAGADDAAATAYINGEQRYIESPLTFVFAAQATNTYDVYVVGDGGGPAFTMEVVSGAPVGTNTRKVAEVDWNLTSGAITELRITEGRFNEHAHTLLDGSDQLPHSAFADLTTGDEHTQYIHKDGRRPFTAEVEGVTPTSNLHLTTKGYADGLLASGVPTGSVIPYGGSSAPSGWLLCDGTSYLVATYPVLAALLNDAYGGDGGTNFNVPDLRGTFPYGKPTAGTGSTLGDTGGSLDHTHSQPTHTHSESAHSHSITAHTHSSPTTATGGAHTHTQSSTGSDGSHTHAGGSHTHTSGFSVGTSAGATVGAANGSGATAGLISRDQIAVFSSSTSHSHSDGSYTAGGTAVIGTSSSNSFSHYHPLAENAKQHSHSSSSLSGTTGAAGTGNTGAGGTHSHTNATTGSDGDHTHTIGTSGSGMTSTQSNTPGTTGSGGGDTTGSENPPFQAVNYIIKADS